MASTLMNTPISLEMNGLGPNMAQVRSVPDSLGVIANSAVLLALNGLRKSSLIEIRPLSGPARISMISMRPAPALPLLSHS